MPTAPATMAAFLSGAAQTILRAPVPAATVGSVAAGQGQKKRPLVAGGPESFALESALGVLAGEVEAEGGQSHANHKEQEPSGSHINPPW